MGRLILIRHGESEGNRDRVFTPSPEVPLTAAGCEQVRAAADWIATRYAPARIVSSPFRRAVQTAEIIAARLALPVSIEADLRERSYGELAGRPYAVARTSPGYDPAAYWMWCPPGGGETLVDVSARAGGVLDRLAGATPDGDVVVVSHGAVMMALWRHVTGEWRQGRVSRNAGVVVVEHAGGAYRGCTAFED
jgi:broad specificity phosphatase PhoE